MRVKDRLALDLIYITLTEKIRCMMMATPYLCRHHSQDDCIRIIKQHFPSWQYNGVAQWDDILQWCEKQFGNNWIWNWETIYFKHKEDKLLFLLRWS